MGTFITQDDTPTLFADKVPAVPSPHRPADWTDVNTVQAADLNAVKNALLDCRTAIRGGLAWQDDVDLNFITQSNANLTSDGSQVIGGYTFTKINTANESAVMALVNGSGLRITPAAATDYYAGTLTAPGLRLGLSTVISDFHPPMPLRFWIYLKNANISAQYDAFKTGVEKLSPTYHFLGSITWVGAARGTGATVTLNGGGLGFPHNTSAPYTTHNVLMLEYPHGVAGGVMRVASGAAVANDFPDLSALQYSAGWLEADGVGAGPFAVANSAWTFCMVGQRAGSGTSLVLDIGRLKVQHFGESA